VTIALVTDSTACLPVDLLADRSIGVVPLHVILGGKDYAEGIDVGSAQVAEALRSFVPVSTSRPSPQGFLAAYQEAADRGATHVVSVHISADLSSTLGSAQLAAQHSPIPVTVVDSRLMGMAMGYAVLTGADVAASGADADEVERAVRERCSGAMIAFYVDTLEYLRRGGRIGKASALLGSALAIKPILGLNDGRVEPIEKVRTSARAIARLAELSVEAALAAGERGVDIAVHHLDSSERAEALATRLREQVPQLRDLHVTELGAVMGAHAGPGTLAVGVSPRWVPGA
jgi:DegV family protein with EDD domain